MEIDYQRFDRYDAPTDMTVRLGPNTARNGTVTLSLSRSFVDRIGIDSITPEPDSVETGPDSVSYVFAVKEPSRPGAVRYNFQYERAGPVNGEVRMQDGPSLAFSVFVWP